MSPINAIMLETWPEWATWALLGLCLGFLVSVALLVGWLVLGRRPRYRRVYARARRLLDDGDWEAALDLVRPLQDRRKLSAAWQGRLRSLHDECERAAGDAALREKRYEESLGHYQKVTALLSSDTGALRSRVLDSMLGEVRRLFATCPGKEGSRYVQELVERILVIESPCPEASFWQGLCLVRDGRLELARAALTAAHE